MSRLVLSKNLLLLLLMLLISCISQVNLVIKTLQYTPSYVKIVMVL